MSKRIALAMAAVMVLSGCRIVSQKELAALQSPVNPHLAKAGAIYHEQMVPQVMKSAVPLANLIAQIEQAKDFDTACQQLGYRAQPEFPCHFSTQVSGEIVAINTQSRSGRLTLKLATGPIESVEVQIGPCTAARYCATAIVAWAMAILTIRPCLGILPKPLIRRRWPNWPALPQRWAIKSPSMACSPVGNCLRPPCRSRRYAFNPEERL